MISPATRGVRDLYRTHDMVIIVLAQAQMAKDTSRHQSHLGCQKLSGIHKHPKTEKQTEKMRMNLFENGGFRSAVTLASLHTRGISPASSFMVKSCTIHFYASGPRLYRNSRLTPFFPNAFPNFVAAMISLLVNSPDHWDAGVHVDFICQS